MWCKEKLSIENSMTSVAAEEAVDDLLMSTIPCNTEVVFDIMHQVSELRPMECGILLTPGSWFREFAEAVEGLPVGVYLSLADSSMGYPVLYANKHTEDFSGQSRSVILGERNSLYDVTAEDSRISKRFRWALDSAVPTRCIVTASSSTGDTVPVTLLSKPLFDVYSRYRYVITMQTADLSSEALLRLSVFLLYVPNVVFEVKNPNL